MPSTFVNPVVNPDMQLGISAFAESEPHRHWPTASLEEIEGVIRAVYRQVLGNAYVMESEQQLIPESQFRRGELSVVEFIRQIAYCDLYRDRFFTNGSRNRFIELNFKHFLGRAPESVAEVAHHSAILDSQGYEAEIDSYLYSEEYQQAFGSETVPYYRGYRTGAGTKLVGFTHIFPLLRGASSSDKNVTANNPARLNAKLFANQASQVLPPSGATSRQGSGPRTTEDLLRSVFNRPAPVAPPEPAPVSPYAGMDDSALAQKARSQSTQIAELQAQIDNMRSLSTMGAAMLRKGQRLAPAEIDPYAAKPVAVGSTLERQVSEQAQQIEKLQGELMSARSLSTIAEFKLNKWRRRSY
jgi:phycoerythrin-associated linker protein